MFTIIKEQYNFDQGRPYWLPMGGNAPFLTQKTYPTKFHAPCLVNKKNLQIGNLNPRK